MIQLKGWALALGASSRVRRGHQPRAGARGTEHLRRPSRSQGHAGQRRADRERDQGARPRGGVLQRQRRRSPRSAPRSSAADGARARGARRGGSRARAPPLARVRDAQALRRRSHEGSGQPVADGHDARRHGAQPRLLDAGGRRARAHDARRPHLRDDLRPGHARAAALRPVSAAKAALESHIRQLAAELGAARASPRTPSAPGVTDTPAPQKIPRHDADHRRGAPAQPAAGG